ncbi:MAG: SAM-dependent chlorinase/fluorinase [Phycisphaerales bacterium]|nr:SAM-dependent chlorinase/fluorinase [Phycisphaerales bacterium]
MSIITLSTDIGKKDFIVPAIKGQLLTRLPGCQIIDISHDFSKDNRVEISYICKQAFQYYPANTIHLICIDTFGGNNEHLLLAIYGNHFIICPDNGSLTMIDHFDINNIRSISLTQLLTKNILSYTNVMAEIAFKLQNQNINTIGTMVQEYIQKIPIRASYTNNWIDAHIIYIDKFDNVVINIQKEDFERIRKNRKMMIEFSKNQQIREITSNFIDSQDGDVIAWFNSANYLELSVRNGNMATLFGLNIYEEHLIGNMNAFHKDWLYHSVRILFE